MYKGHTDWSTAANLKLAGDYSKDVAGQYTAGMA
jgi:hypothetical protein